ncbi:hypothetical protein GUJ93_ZPchr0006g43955 [Zizania palustris]|uniref:Uncharacterized protein n=1 Tax=Zizania palustris TaxID=103762 RepID=A0A8J5VIB3_ZIZPA|nr:hypothetical protein GUJ93_ZPchr0006g43955 [Zizania palustris]
MGHNSVFDFPTIDGLGGWAMALAVRRRFYWGVVLVLHLALAGLHRGEGMLDREDESNLVWPQGAASDISLAKSPKLGDYYYMIAKSVKMPCPNYKCMHEGCKVAYTEMTVKHAPQRLVDWWNMCVKDSFIRGSEWDFGVFSSIAGVDKKNGRMYEVALEMDDGMAPAEALHIGDSMCKVLNGMFSTLLHVVIFIVAPPMLPPVRQYS